MNAVDVPVVIPTPESPREEGKVEPSKIRTELTDEIDEGTPEQDLIGSSSDRYGHEVTIAAGPAMVNSRSRPAIGQAASTKLRGPD